MLLSHFLWWHAIRLRYTIIMTSSDIIVTVCLYRFILNVMSYYSICTISSYYVNDLDILTEAVNNMTGFR